MWQKKQRNGCPCCSKEVLTVDVVSMSRQECRRWDPMATAVNGEAVRRARTVVVADLRWKGRGNLVGVSSTSYFVVRERR
ncbi:hypothetical protein DEO72_LG3g783 [Vigna unguiculata]|uniref:Uncharacterized protein n=1 Tax=Vigna unguiculata TaxID=3917 RepID=A0A4D6LCF5_VIGUN|nr:hypothetical protein DEO72_LG3g783 [Vigna unguiculata]